MYVIISDDGERRTGPVDAIDRQPAGRSEGAAGSPYRLPGPCLPEAISYDPADEAAAPTHARMISEPGRQPKRFEALRLRAVAWWCGPWGLGGQPQGWRRVVPCLALITDAGELVRVFGWDAISDFTAIIMSTDPSAVADGVDVHIRTGVSPGGDHWWWVVGRVTADGEIIERG